MTESAQTILGFDPGGKSGVAILRVGGGEMPSLEWATVNSVDGARDWYQQRLHGSSPKGIGIDTPLCWETGPCGWRGPDRWLRDRYPAMLGSVLSTNSAYGAMVVQGMALALRLAERIGEEIALNETHPKVLHYALRKMPYPREAFMPADAVGWLFSLIGIATAPPFSITSDEWDAVISAWATYQGVAGCWRHDLMEEGTDPLFPAGRATYFWPE
jgi:hypothetical protein